MPIEHERKYILRPSDTLEAFLRDHLPEYEGSIHEIQQAYIGKEGRIRKKNLTHYAGYELNIIDSIFCESRPELIFTYKHRLTKRKGALELEMNMTEEDFSLAWEENNACLVKTRITLNMPWNEAWEIDFFKHNNYTYLLLAECELTGGKNYPTRMPDIVKDNLLFVVPENDSRFKNRNLTDPEQVSKLIEHISMESKHGQTTQSNETLSL